MGQFGGTTELLPKHSDPCRDIQEGYCLDRRDGGAIYYGASLLQA